MERRRRLVPFIGLLGLAVLVVGIPASGAIPNSGDGKFYACLVKDSGAIRLINYPKVDGCSKGQKLIHWGRTGPQGPQGAQGEQGAQGPQGAPGAAGTAGITKITLTPIKTTLNVPATSAGSATAACPAGRVTGGGFTVESSDVVIMSSRPEGGIGWYVTAFNPAPTSRWVDVYAVCMTTEPATVIAKVGKKGKRR